MARFTMETRKLRGPSDQVDRARRAAAKEIAQRFVTAFVVALAGKHPEVVIEAARWIIRAMSRLIEDKGDAGRAQGILAGAAADISPAYQPTAGASFAEADAALFGKAAA